MTPIYGNTTPGNQQSDFLKVLQAITNAPPSNLAPEDLQRAQQSAQSTALSMNVNQQPNVQAAKDNLTQQSGIPQLQGQYGDLAKLFPLYLHDSNLAGKYTNPNASANPFVDPNLAAAGAPQVQQPDASVFGTPQTTGQISGQAIAAPNPYLASADALVASGANAPQDPGTTTSMMAAPAKMATNFMDLINQAIGTEQGIVGNKTKEYSDKYSGIVSALSTLANVFGTEASARRTANTPGSAGSIQSSLDNVKSDANSGMTFQDMVSKYATDPNMSVDKVLQIYNAVHANDKVVEGSMNPKEWGPARQTAEQLGAMGVSGGFLTEARAADKEKATKDIILSSSQAILENAKMMKDELNRENWFTRNFPGAKYANPNVAQANARLMTNISDLKKAIGGRVTQQELFKWLDATFPSGKDISPEVMDAKIQVLQDKVNNAIKAEGGTGSSGSSKDPLGIL